MTTTTKKANRWPLASLSLSMLLASLGTSIANVSLPTMAHDFATSFQAVQWIVLSYLLAVTTLIVSVGRLGDMIGRQRLLFAGLCLFTLASLCAAFAPSLAILIAARALQGLGAATMMALSMALTSESVTKENTGRAMGLLATMSATGTALGPSLGGLLIGNFGWPAIYHACALPGLIAAFLVWRHLPFKPTGEPTKPATSPGFDLAGTIVLALSLGAYALAMTMGRGHFGLFNAGLLIAAILGIGLFVAIEARAKAPLIRLALFSDRALNASLAMSGLVSTLMMATLVVGPFYLARALGLPASRVGLVMSIGPIVAALSGVPAGRLTDRFGALSMTKAGLSGMIAGCLLLAGLPLFPDLPLSTGLLFYILPIIIMTSAYALFQTANNTALMADVAPAQRGTLSGLVNLARNLGLITGASMMGAVFSLATGSTDILSAAPAHISFGLRVTFGVAAVLILLALGLAGTITKAGARRI